MGSSDFHCPAGFGLDEFAAWSEGLRAQGFVLCGKIQKPCSEELPNFESFLREWRKSGDLENPTLLVNCVELLEINKS